MKWFIYAALLTFMACPAWAKDVVADVSEHKIDVSVGFSGTKLLVFGAMKKPADVAVIVQGPTVHAKLWTKKREMGIWVNGRSVTFEQVPGYYAVATTRAAFEMAQPRTSRRYGLSLADLVLPRTSIGKGLVASDYDALKQAEWTKKHYQEKQSSIRILEQSLFRVDFDLPDSVPKGAYKAEVHLLERGKVTATQTVPFTVEQVGLEASIYHLAHKRPFLYAFLALASSLGIGGLAAYIFRRMS